MSSSTTPENSIFLNEWTHVAVCYDGVDQVKMFVNDDEVMSTQPTAPSSILEDNSEDDIYLGNLSALNKSFDGILDEIRVWNYFMNQTEVQENMNKYLHSWESGLTHYWKFNEANGEIIFDTAGNNAGVISEAIWIEGIELDPVETEQINIIHPKIDLKCYPNPFNPSTTILFELNSNLTGNAEISIYNLKVQKIRQYSISNDQSSITWNGTDENNQPISSGIYFYKMKAEGIEQTKKMILLK